VKKVLLASFIFLADGAVHATEICGSLSNESQAVAGQSAALMQIQPADGSEAVSVSPPE
jgi:hypothetical protein